MNKRLKLLSLLFIIPTIFSCTRNDSTHVYSAYYDNVQFNQGNMELDFRYTHHSSNPYFYLLIKNTSVQTITITIRNAFIFREATGAKYTVDCIFPSGAIESDLTKDFLLSSTLPTSTADENYELRFTLNTYDLHIKLYETPDELRKDVTLTYTVNNQIVHQETMKSGRTIANTYIYETGDHQKYVSVWKDENENTYGLGAKVDNDLTLHGTLLNSLILATTSSDAFTFINGISHVHSDGKVVVESTYLNKEICIGNYAFYRNSEIREIYLPTTVHQIYNGNFLGCGNLTTIYFAGNQEQWEAIPKSTVQMPETIGIVYNTSFITD